MKKKYMSMQEELAARKAASENTAREGIDAGDIPDAEYSPMGESAYGHFERTGHGRNPAENFLAERGRKRAVTAAVVFVAVVFFAVAGVFIVDNLIGDGPRPGETDPTEWTGPTEWTDPTEWTESTGKTDPTERTRGTRPAYPPEGEIGERSTITDIEEYVAGRTEPLEDEDVLFGTVYEEIRIQVEKGDTENNWYVSDGRIYIWGGCSEKDDPEEMLEKYTRINDSVKKVLRKNDLENTPVIIAVHDSENWYLRLLLIDGEPEFISGYSRGQ